MHPFHDPQFSLENHLLYRDGLILVIDKPAGIAVHAGSGKNDALERFFDQLRYGLPRAPTLTHRLDKATSGCLILARHRKAAQRMQKLFEAGKIHKTYMAWVMGGPTETQGLIDLSLAPLSEDPSQWHMGVSEDGKPAQTHYEVIKRLPDHSLLRLRPLTGRTHQLRVHCAASGFPIVGDFIYGTGGPTRLFLHAESLTFPLYPAKLPLKIEAPLPDEFITFSGENPHAL